MGASLHAAMLSTPTGDRPAARTSARTLLVAIATAVWVALIYSNALSGPFVFDDNKNLVKNEAIRMRELSLDAMARAAHASALPRPVAYLSFAFNYYLHGYEVEGYRIFNILLHLLTGFALHRLVWLTLARTTLSFEETRARRVATLGTLIWLVHPLHTQTVSYVVQRMNGLAAFGFVVSLWCFVSGRLAEGRTRALRWMASLLAFAFAVGSKEIALTLPAVLLLYEWYFFRDLDARWLRRLAPFALGAGVVVIVAFVGASSFVRLWLTEGYSRYDFTPAERLLTEPSVVAHYVTLLLWPHPSRLMLLYDFPISRSPFEPMTTLLGFAAVIAMLGAAVWLARRERLLSFALLWFLGNLVLESSFVPIELIYEHRTYLPSMFLVVALVELVLRLAPSARLATAGCLAVALLFSAWTLDRNWVWSDELELWRDNLAKTSGMDRVASALAYSLEVRAHLFLKMQQPHEAQLRLEEAVRLQPDYADTYVNLGVALAEQGDFDGAIRVTRQALALAPGHAAARTNLAAYARDRAGRATTEPKPRSPE